MKGIDTKFMFRLSLDVGVHHVVGQTPMGARRIAPISGGTFEGPELSGIVLPGGTDWITEDPEGTWFGIDVRVPLQTHDGALIMMRYQGFRRGSSETLSRLAKGEELDPASYYYRVAGFFETASEKYAKLNTTVAVADGWRLPTGPGYDVYEVL